MLFTSAAFFWGYLPIVFLGYYVLGRRSPIWAASWLFLASVVFYGYWMPEFTLLLLGSILWNFWVGSTIGRLDPLSGEGSERRRAKSWLIAGIFVDLVWRNMFFLSSNSICLKRFHVFRDRQPRRIASRHRSCPWGQSRRY